MISLILNSAAAPIDTSQSSFSRHAAFRVKSLKKTSIFIVFLSKIWSKVLDHLMGARRRI